MKLPGLYILQPKTDRFIPLSIELTRNEESRSDRGKSGDDVSADGAHGKETIRVVNRNSTDPENSPFKDGDWENRPSPDVQTGPTSS